MEDILEKINSDKEKFDRLYDLCMPLVEYLKQYCDPHTSIIISEDYIRLVRDEVGIPVEIND